MLRLPSVRPADDDFASSGMLPDDGDGRNIDWRANVEVFWILVLFFLLASSLPPNVNEAHYLTKARHFWDATFCAGDLFLESGEGHLGFCLALGWLTKYLSLPACAWVGRLLAWTALAWGWQRLSFSLVPIRGASILSAGVWAALVEYGHMSGEWVLGGWEAKVFAYALVFRGLREMVIGRWDRTGIWMGAATAMHVLVGGWTWLLVAISWLAQGAASRGSIRQLLKYWSWGVALAAIGLMPALQLQFGVDGLTLQAAHQIYTWGRLSHHLMLRAFPSDFVARHVLLMIVFLLISQLHPRPAGVLRLAYVVWGAILLALLGALIDATLGAQPWGASLLRFYWFRIADVFVPMGVSLLGLAQLRQRFEVSPRPIRAFICGIGALVLAYGTHSVAHDRQQTIAPGDQQGGIWSESQMRDWRDACAWIKQNVPTKAMMLTPPDHQTFKWYAERPEVVTSKDVPQDARGLVEWWRRLTEVHRWQATADHDQAKRRLDELVTNYRVDYVLIRVYPGYVIPPRPVIYQNPSYVLLEGLAASAHVNESQANDSLSAVESSSAPFSTSSNAATADDHQSQAVGR